jgi:NB-ARC domain/Bacterial regulatory protein, Fis family
VALAEHFLAQASTEYGLAPRTLRADARAKLAAHSWPGNVRELANTMERVVLLSGTGTGEITAVMIDFSQTAASAVVGSLDEALRARIEVALRDTGGNIRRSAAALGISRNTLRARMEKYGLRHRETSEPSLRGSPARPRMAPAGAEGRRAPGGPAPDLTVPRHNLPTPLTLFIGREVEVAEIRGLLVGDPDCRLLTLVGPGGIGKTRLALRVADTVLGAHVEHGKFAQGVFFIVLEAARSASDIVTLILSGLAEGSGASIQPAASLHGQLLDFVRSKNLLLVLDNVEQLVAEADLLAEILAVAPGVKILTTSRVALNLPMEWLHPVGGLAYPRAAQADRTMMAYDGHRGVVSPAELHSRHGPRPDQPREHPHPAGRLRRRQAPLRASVRNRAGERESVSGHVRRHESWPGDVKARPPCRGGRVFPPEPGLGRRDWRSAVAGREPQSPEPHRSPSQ